MRFVSPTVSLFLSATLGSAARTEPTVIPLGKARASVPRGGRLVMQEIVEAPPGFEPGMEALQTSLRDRVVKQIRADLCARAHPARAQIVCIS